MTDCKVPEDEATLRRIVAVLNPFWHKNQYPVGFDEARRVIRAINAKPRPVRDDAEFDERGYDEDGFDRYGFDEHGRYWEPNYRLYL